MNDILKNIFQTISENAEKNFIANQNADDYIAEDGLWHCGKCGTAKQFRMPEELRKMGMPEIVGSCCACQSAKEKREKAEQQLAAIISRNKELANIPEHYLSADIVMVESPDARKVGMNYIRNFEKMDRTGLLLYGDVGTGKTYLAACIANTVRLIIRFLLAKIRQVSATVRSAEKPILRENMAGTVPQGAV